MFRSLLILFFVITFLFDCNADRIYIMNSTGYNRAEPELITAIANNGHTIVENTSLPADLTSTCVDPVNGFDWLCFFGTANFSSLTAEIQDYIDSGGKVFYQYEVSCCVTSTNSIASIISDLTGLSITPNANSYIAWEQGGSDPGWIADDISCCASFAGSAYKGLDGLPLANQLQATSTVSGGTPPIETCLNFGFLFSTEDFLGAANNGAIIGLGDINVWYNGDEPFWNDGNNPINLAVVDYIFPNSSSTCYAFPPGCIDATSDVGDLTFALELGNDTTLCEGESLTLNAYAPDASYQWQDNSSDSVFTVIQPGTYWVQLTHDCGSISDTITVAFETPPLVDLGADTALCPGESLILDATSANASYLWQDDSTNPTFEVNQSGQYWVSLNEGGCAGVDTINVEFFDLQNINLGEDVMLCEGESLTLDATTAGASYLWQDGSTNPSFQVSQEGTYWVSIDVNGCVTSDTVNVDFTDFPVVDLGNDTLLCEGETLTLDAATSNATYQWQDSSSGPTLTASQEGTYWVVVSVNGCETTDTVGVNFYVLQNPDLGNDTTLCSGQFITLDASAPGADYLWHDNSTDPTFVVTGQGLYWVELLQDCGSTRDSVLIDYIEPPTVNLGIDTTLCQDETLLLDATTANASYQWQDQSTAATFEVTQTGTYSVLVEVNNCQAGDAINVDYLSSEDFDLGNDTTLCLEESLILDATTEGATYLWQDSSSNSSFLVTGEGTYWVQVSFNGCVVNPHSVTIDYEDCNGYVYIPNAFTPNGDGHNDIFKPSITGGDVVAYEMLIVNRWGEVIFESTEIDLGWNGAGAKGSEYFSQNEVYVYYIRLTGLHSFTEEYSGSVTLIR